MKLAQPHYSYQAHCRPPWRETRSGFGADRHGTDKSLGPLVPQVDSNFAAINFDIRRVEREEVIAVLAAFFMTTKNRRLLTGTAGVRPCCRSGVFFGAANYVFVVFPELKGIARFVGGFSDADAWVQRGVEGSCFESRRGVNHSRVSELAGCEHDE